MVAKMLMVGFGGFVGSVFRWLAGKYIADLFDSNFPWGTFLVNITGSFIIGIILSLSSRNVLINDDLRLFLAVGFCGGFTTFSTFAWENLQALQSGNFGIAILYTVLSFTVGLLAVWGGFALFKA